MEPKRINVEGFNPTVLPPDVADHVKAEITTARDQQRKRHAAEGKRDAAESAMIATAGTLYRIVRGDLRGMRSADGGLEMTEDATVKAFFGPTFKGSTSEWMAVADGIHHGFLPQSVIDNGGLKAAVRWVREHRKVTAEAVSSAKDSGMATAIAKATVPATLKGRFAKAEEAFTARLTEEPDASAEVNVTRSIVDAFPESKAAKDALKAASERAKSRTKDGGGTGRS